MNEQIITWLIAGGGWLVAILTVAIGYIERRESREEESFGKTLAYFDGGSQRRSIGIAFIEGVWGKKKRYRDVIVPLVANQIVYLLLSSESHDAHNERNLVRLVEILRSVPRLREDYRDRWQDVCDAIYRKHDGESKGIPVTQQTLKCWADDFGFDLGTYV